MRLESHHSDSPMLYNRRRLMVNVGVVYNNNRYNRVCVQLTVFARYIYIIAPRYKRGGHKGGGGVLRCRAWNPRGILLRTSTSTRARAYSCVYMILYS